MEQAIKGGKLITLFVARDQRSKLIEIEQEMRRLVDVVDDFYDRLGPRNWIFHDLLNVDRVEAILRETEDAEAAEQRFIQLYQDEEATKWWLLRLRGRDGLRERFHLIERAQQHYRVDEFDSCVLHLIAVMDGFVNDFEPDVRRGLASRDPDDMTAWDSVVGHHLGLTHVMETFTKSVRKRRDAQVTELYRHGIMHGMILNFNNIIVATKAWNMLFAVADWATAVEKAARPQEPPPSWSGTWSAIGRQAAYNRYKKKFIPSVVTPSDAEFESDDVAIVAAEFLDAWQHKRWGLVAAFAPAILIGSKSQGEQARYAKDIFVDFDLTGWAISVVNHDMASGSETRANVIVNQEQAEIRFRMVLQTVDGNIAMPSDEGASWRLAVWAPHTFFRQTS